jgi:hypothetical protein
MDKKHLEERIKMVVDAIAQCAAQHNALCGRKAELDELLAALSVEVKESEDAIKEG